MNAPLTAPVHAAPLSNSLTRFTLIRIVLGIVAVCLPVALVLILSNQIPDKSLRAFWPPLLAALVGISGYLFYVRKVEHRPATELSSTGAGVEFGAGLLLGTLLFLTVIGLLAAIGSFHVTGTGNWPPVATSLVEMLFVALIEELVFRGVLLRLTERSLGSRVALVLSAVIFAVAHLPNDGITALAVANTALAGLLFGAAYLITRRLWLTVGMHFAWNFVSDGVFGIPTSGHPARGLLQGQLSGPDWLAGGAYGVEASAVTLVMIALFTVLLLLRASRNGHLVSRTAARAQLTAAEQ